MQPDYKETWAVIVGKEKFVLDEKQIQVLKKADLSGHRGVLWFDDFAISLPHVTAIYRLSRQLRNQLEAPEKQTRELTEEERKKNLEKLDEIRARFNFKS